MSKKITHNEMEDDVFTIENYFNINTVITNRMKEYIKQQEKKTKLLELYKELVNLHNQYLNEKDKMKKLEIIRKTSNVEDEIKVIENEV